LASDPCIAGKYKAPIGFP
jgi:hypothetical protein